MGVVDFYIENVGKTTLVNKLLIKQKQRTTVKKYNNANGQNVSTDGIHTYEKK